MNLILFVSIIVIIIKPISSARILAVVPTPSYSHQVALQPLWKELSLRGHQVTLITTNPIKDSSLKNLTEIDLSVVYKEWRKFDINQVADMNVFNKLKVLKEANIKVMHQELQHSEVQKLIRNKNEHYDVALVKPFFAGMVAFAERFNCPLIQIFSVDALTEYYHLIGHPSHPVLNPDVLLPFSGKLNFFERLLSSLYVPLFALYSRYILLPEQDLMVKRYFGSHIPPIQEIFSKTSLMFVNTDFVFHPIRPLLPNVIQIGGGTHVTSTKPLPEELQNILNAAKNGAIYFSLGSNVKSSQLPEDTKKIFLEVFSELPYTILWKFEEDLQNTPDNVFISKWYPQQDIFRHPNVKLFISQGGLQSMDEAVHNHIPIIGIPFLGDQESNVGRMEKMGIGLRLNVKTLDKQILKNVILEVMNNPKYRNRVKELAELAKDQPMTGLERAVWWTEYVIRHKGAKHLRSPALDLPAYQYYLLDVIGFCLLVILIVIYLLLKLVKLSLKCIKCILPKSKIKTQ